MPLPWESGSSGFAPWQIGQYFTDANGNTYQVYADPNSQSGYTLKKIDAAGNVTFTTGPTPNDPGAQARWVQQFLKTPEGKPYADSEAASAAQNTFNQNLQTSQLGVSQATQRAQQANMEALVQQAKDQLAFERERQNQQNQIAQGNLEVARGGLEVQRGQLGVSQGQLGLGTLQLGAQLRGPRDVFAYDRMAGATSSNPILANAVSTWADLTNNRPTGMGAWQGGTPERASLGALAADFGGLGSPAAGAGSAAGGDNGKQQTLAALDNFFRNPHQAAPGFLESMNPTQLAMTQGAADELGHDWDTVQARYHAGRIGQGLGRRRVA
jgi:hypothetical protein